MLKQAKQMKSRFKTKNIKTFFPKPSMGPGHRTSSLQRETLPPTPQPPSFAIVFCHYLSCLFFLFFFPNISLIHFVSLLLYPVDFPSVGLNKAYVHV